jgi:hypothetical protein
MWTFLLIVLVAVLIFLGVTGTEGIEDRKHRASLSTQIGMSDSTKGGINMLHSGTTEPLTKNVPTPEEIRQRAYEIHIERGGFYGCDMDDLLQAERELQQKYNNNEKRSEKT